MLENGIGNVVAKNINAIDYGFEEGKFDLIVCLNLLQFLSKEKGLGLVEKIKANLSAGGVAVVSAFTQEDPMFEKMKDKGRCFFAKDELGKMFADFKVIHYEERMVDDPGHGGMEFAHKHGIVELISRKL